MLPKRLRAEDTRKKCRQYRKKPMISLKIQYYLEHVNNRGELAHPSGLSFKDWKKHLEAQLYEMLPL